MRPGSKFPLLIAGGGIGGLSAAIALRQAGFEVEVFERAPEIREVGAGVTLMSNALLALSCLGLDEAVRKTGDRLDRADYLSSRQRLLKRVPLDGLERLCGAPSIGITRPDLISILHAACRDIPVYTSSRCIAYEQNNDEVVLRLENGREVRGSALIGADGVWSTIRSQVVGDGLPIYAHSASWRGICESVPEDEALRGSVFIAFGHSTVRGGGWYVSKNRISWLIAQDVPPQKKDDTPVKIKPRLQKLLKGWRGRIPSLVERTPEELMNRTDLYVREPVNKWGEGRVTLLGDAAHAMGNAIGQGAAQAIEDAIILADTLKNATDLVAGLRTYEQRRMPRAYLAQRITRQSLPVKYLESPYLSWYRNMKFRRIPNDKFIALWQQIMVFEEGAALLAKTPVASVAAMPKAKTLPESWHSAASRKL